LERTQKFEPATWPDAGGLLPWGRTGGSQVLAWSTVGEADAWPVVVLDFEHPLGGTWEYGGGMARFLVDVLTGQVVVPSLQRADGYEGNEQPRFMPVRTRRAQPRRRGRG